MRHGMPTGSLSRWLAVGAAAGAGFMLGRALGRAGRELGRYRESARKLRSVWTSIPSPVDADALRLHAWVHDGPPYASPPIVLVHGYGIGASYFLPLAARLAENAQVYAPELPGHGSSPHAARPLTIEQHADALAAWMSAWELRFALIVGHSMGSQVAVELAARHPDLAAGLMLIGPTSDAAARTGSALVLRALRNTAYERPGLGLLAARDFGRAGASVLAGEMRQLLDHSIEAPLLKVQVPVRVVRGEADRIVPQRWAETVTRIVAGPPPIVIPGWGHAVHYDDPETVARLVLQMSLEVGGGQPVPMSIDEGRHGQAPLPAEKMPTAG